MGELYIEVFLNLLKGEYRYHEIHVMTGYDIRCFSNNTHCRKGAGYRVKSNVSSCFGCLQMEEFITIARSTTLTQ